MCLVVRFRRRRSDRQQPLAGPDGGYAAQRIPRFRRNPVSVSRPERMRKSGR